MTTTTRTSGGFPQADRLQGRQRKAFLRLSQQVGEDVRKKVMVVQKRLGHLLGEERKKRTSTAAVLKNAQVSFSKGRSVLRCTVVYPSRNLYEHNRPIITTTCLCLQYVFLLVSSAVKEGSREEGSWLKSSYKLQMHLWIVVSLRRCGPTAFMLFTISGPTIRLTNRVRDSMIKTWR